MSPSVPLLLPSLLLGLFCIVALVEHSLYGGINRLYYTRGLPLVTLRVPVASPAQDIPSVDLLQAQFRSALIGPVRFVELAPDTYAFRRQFYRPALLPGFLMHGMLLYDRQNSRVVLRAFINLWVPLLLLAVLAFSVFGPLQGWSRLLPLAILFLVIGTPLLLERRRCLQIARFAANTWNTAHEKAGSQ